MHVLTLWGPGGEGREPVFPAAPRRRWSFGDHAQHSEAPGPSKWSLRTLGP